MVELFLLLTLLVPVSREMSSRFFLGPPPPFFFLIFGEGGYGGVALLLLVVFVFCSFPTPGMVFFPSVGGCGDGNGVSSSHSSETG
jgi:hypothetical protein